MGIFLKKWMIIIFLPTMLFAKVNIINVSLYEKEQILYIDLISDIKITDEISNAIKNGMNLVFSYSFKIKSDDWLNFKNNILLKKSYHLSYDQIIDEYKITNPVTYETKYFKKFQKAIISMESLKSFPLILINKIPKEKPILKIKFHLESTNLPTFIKLERLFNDNWNINSSWKTWPIPLIKIK